MSILLGRRAPWKPYATCVEIVEVVEIVGAKECRWVPIRLEIVSDESDQPIMVALIHLP